MAKKSTTIDDLAGMVKRGFDETKHDVGLLQSDIEKIKRKVDVIDERVENIEKLLLKQHTFQIQALEKRRGRL